MNQILIALAAAVIAILTAGAATPKSSHTAPPVVAPYDIVPPTGL